MPRLKRGDIVRMSGRLKRAFRANLSGDHVLEFGESVGIVEGLTAYDGFDGPELEVRWQPSGLRYAYDSSGLVLVRTRRRVRGGKVRMSPGQRRVDIRTVRAGAR